MVPMQCRWVRRGGRLRHGGMEVLTPRLSFAPLTQLGALEVPRGRETELPVNCSRVSGGPEKSTVGVYWVQLQRSAILCGPALVWVSQVDDVRDPASGDDVIVAQQVAALGIAVARAVGFIDQGPLWQPCDLHEGQRDREHPLCALVRGFA